MKTIIEFSDKLSGYFVHRFTSRAIVDIESRHDMDFISLREVVWC